MSDSPLVITLRRREWDIASRDELRVVLEPASQRSAVIVDMSDVTFMDSTALSEIVAMQLARHQGGLGPAAFVVTNANILRLFKLVKFDRLWPIFETAAAALEGVSL